jgi:hypothetical protein
MSHYVQESSTLKASEPSGVMVMLTIQLLKELGLVHKLTSFKNATNIAGSVIRILWATTLRDGRIYHENPALRYLNHHDKDNRTIHKGENHKCDGLFYRDSKGGNPLHGSFKYHLSRRGETFIRELVRRYMELTLAETKLDVRPEDLLVKKSDVERLHTRDQVVLLSRCAGTKEGLLHIVNDISDTQDSRVYGLMTMLTSSGRTTLGYHQYDITACLQSIVFDILDAKAPYKATKRFPEHFNMVVDRKSFRNKIASEIGKDIAWVKKTLTKIDNGGSVHKDTLSKSETLMRYKDESRPFVDEYMEYADPDMLSTSRRHSKVYNIDNPFVKERIGIKYDEDGRKIFGKFFFTWTQTERYIRELMKSSFSGYSHDVHDAIATREAIDVEVINKTISDAGFKYTKVEL